MPPHPPTSTLFPYTTLFRSRGAVLDRAAGVEPLRLRVHLKPRVAGLEQADPQQRGVADQLRDGVLDCRSDHRSEEHTSELQSLRHLVCRLLLEKYKKRTCR